MDLDKLIAQTRPSPRPRTKSTAPPPAPTALPDWSTTRPPKLTFARFRSCQAQEGEAWSADVFIDGRKAAFAEEGGYGGPMSFDWTPSGGSYNRPSPLGEALIAWIKAQPPRLTECDEGLPESDRRALPLSLDWFVAECLDQWTEEANLRRWCRASVVFRLPGDKPGSYRKIAMKWATESERFREWAAKRYPGVAVEILNERLDAQGGGA